MARIPGAPAAPAAPALLPPEVRAALARGDKIEAIKLLRQAWRIGLKEAKDRVDAEAAHAAHAPRAAPASPAAPLHLGTMAPGEQPRRSWRWLWLLLAIALVLALVWRRI